MQTWTYLTDPMLRDLAWPAVLAGLAIAVFCGLLSVLVVLQRLAFIGQGVSHAAFGGAGLAAVLGGVSAPLASTPAQFAVVSAYCLAAALTIGLLSRRAKGAAGMEADTAIGIVLVGSMALGAVLMRVAKSRQSWDSFLFGSIVGVGWSDALIALGVLLAILLTLWLSARPLLFWAFDPPVAEAFGVRTRRVHLVLMGALALATVTAMKLAGVVLATALLIIPGAVALRLSRRLVPVVLLALGSALLGVALGLVASFELDWVPGPSIVLALGTQFALAPLLARALGARRGSDRA